MSRSVLMLIGLMIVIVTTMPQAFAAPKPDTDPCTYIGGGNCTTSAGVVGMVNQTIQSFGDFFVLGAGAFSILAFTIGGFQMLLSYGDEGRFNKGKSSVIWGIVGFGLALATQVIINFVGARAMIAAQNTEAPLLEAEHQVVDSILTLLNIAFVLIVIAAGLRAIIGRGKSDEFTAAKKAVGYAVAGAIIVNLARALAYATLQLFG